MKRRGFAMVTAIVLLAFAATAVSILTVTLRDSVDRQQQLQTDAQLHQLLIAGQLAAARGSRGGVRTPLSDAAISIDGKSVTVRIDRVEREQPLQ